MDDKALPDYPEYVEQEESLRPSEKLNGIIAEAESPSSYTLRPSWESRTLSLTDRMSRRIWRRPSAQTHGLCTD